MRSPSPCSLSLLPALVGMLAGTMAPHLDAGGVTVVTHGFSSNVDSWVLAMANRIPGHPGFIGSEFSCYQIDITQSGGGLSGAASYLGGTVDPTTPDSGEIFIKLDWRTVDGLFEASSDEVAAAAVQALLSTTLSGELGGRALAEQPLHLIGHSRGGSVVAEMAREFGERGVWVDHLTLLDPVDDTPFTGDAPVHVWENVFFADNYWQTEASGTLTDGEYVPGAYNRFLSGLTGGNESGGSTSHSDVHLWYHGTVELGTPANDSIVDITQAERGVWWVGAELQGAAAGFHYSRIGGGNRLSSEQPLGGDRIVDGYNMRWELGAGVDPASRMGLNSNTGEWPNVISCRLAGAGSVAAGETFAVDIYHQSGVAATGDADFRILLDVDMNPWNGNEIEVDQRLLANTGTTSVTASALDVAIDAEVPPGPYAVLAKIAEGGRSRYLYALEGLEVLAPPVIDPDSFRFEGGLVAFKVLATAGQDVTIMASEDLVHWAPIGSQLFTSGTWDFADANSGSFPRRFYLPVITP